MVITQEFLESGRTVRGGYTKQQLKILGIVWPPMRAWKQGVIGMVVSQQVADEFLSAKIGVELSLCPSCGKVLTLAECECDQGCCFDCMA